MNSQTNDFTFYLTERLLRNMPVNLYKKGLKYQVFGYFRKEAKNKFLNNFLRPKCKGRFIRPLDRPFNKRDCI